MKRFIPLMITTFCLSIWVAQPINKPAEALWHFRYAEFGSVAIALPQPVIETDEPIETSEIEEIPEVAEFHQPEFDLSKPYKGQHIGDGVVTSPQGMRVHPVTGVRRIHAGVDWAKSVNGGEPLYAPGKIEVVCKFQASGAGHYAVFKYYGMTWMAMHMQPGTCTPGGHERGWVIGRVGHSGIGTGDHVHVELRGPKNEMLHVGTGHVAAIVVQKG